MKKETKMVYETPWMECMQIEAEGDFMAGSVIHTGESGTSVETTAQGYDEFSSNAFDKNAEGGTNNDAGITWE